MRHTDDPTNMATEAEDFWKQKKENYLWLGPGWHWRKNKEFLFEEEKIKTSLPEKDDGLLQELISQFFNRFIFKNNRLSAKDCCVTKGCTEGIKAALSYYFSQNNKKVLYLVPTYDPILQLCKPSRRIELVHFNETWMRTIQNIENNCKDIGCVVISNPNNPSGIMYPDNFLKKLAKICNRQNIWVLEDGAYFLHCNKHKQTSIISHFDFAISMIGSSKLFLSFKHKIGGAVVSKKLSTKEYNKHVGKILNEDKTWYAYLLQKMLQRPIILKEHLEYVFNISKDIKKLFIKHGFTPLFYTKSCLYKKTPVSPIMSFSYKKNDGELIGSKKLFQILAKNKIITQYIPEESGYKGIRVNTRAFVREDLELLDKNLKLVADNLND